MPRPGGYAQHNGTSMLKGDNWISDVVSNIENGPDWNSTAIFITYDDCGCFYDHVTPPPGRGVRVPMVIVSPYAKAAFTDHTSTGLSGMLSYIEHRFDLAPLTSDDASAYDFADSFDYSQAPRPGVAAAPARPLTRGRPVPAGAPAARGRPAVSPCGAGRTRGAPGGSLRCVPQRCRTQATCRSAETEPCMDESSLAIDAQGVVKRFGDVTALGGFDMRVEAGQIHGLVGPNGAGKTTLLRVLFGLVAADAGAISLLGEDVVAGGGTTVDGVGGFVEEPRFYPYLTARRNLELLVELDGGARDRIDEVLALAGLADRARRKAGTLSSGARQRLGVAASLLRSPRILLLDEPTVGLDPVGMSEMMSMLRGLRAEGLTAVVSSHHMAELESLCDGVTVMSEGRSVWHGSMDRLRAESPAPANRLSTSDDARAAEIARSHSGVAVVVDPEGWLTVSGDREALDEFVVALGRAGIAVRRLELLMSALESMFLALTGAQPDRLAVEAPPGRVEAAP